MKKTGLKVLAVLSALVCLTSAGCKNDKAEALVWGGLSDADIWGAPATEKVYQDISTGYEAFRTDAQVSVTAARGEYEAGQIIVTAKDKDLKYEVSAADLTAADGTKFPAASIEIFHEKYIEITRNWENNGMPLGWYPDALVPVENIKQVGENVIAPNQNQGLYVRFNVPVDQKAGVYTGSIALKIGDESKSIPVTLNVLDVEVSEKTHTQSHYAVNYQYFRGELEQSQSMYEKYCEMLMDYRLSAAIPMEKVTTEPEDVEYYVDLAYKWITEYGCTTIDVPYGAGVEIVNGKKYNSIDRATFSLYLKAFAEKSFETGYNMFDQLITRTGTLIDEPHGKKDGEARVQAVATAWKETKLQVAQELEDDDTITSPIKDEVVEGIRELIDVVTAAYSEVYEGYVETFCPGFTEYDTEASRAKYADQERKWFYGCINPRSPYPTNKIDDTLLSTRVVGWMQAQYDVSGVLYWTTTLYQQGAESGYMDIEDYYGVAERYGKANGDGLLFYPGKRYGVDGPVASMRLEAIRDGLEEYEMLYALEEAYGAKQARLQANGEDISFDFDALIASLTESLYSGTRVSATTETFASARNALLQLCLLQSGADTYLADFADDGYGTASYTFLVGDGATVKVNGETKTASATVTDGDGKEYGKYSFDCALSEAENWLHMQVIVGEGTFAYDSYLGGKVQRIDAAQTVAGDFGKEQATPVYELIQDASTVDGTLTGSIVKLAIPECSAKSAQSVRLGGTLVKDIDATTGKAIVHIYYDGSDEPTLQLSGSYSLDTVYYVFGSTTLKQGMNEIEITFPSGRYEKATLNYMVAIVNPSSKQAEPARDLYFKDLILYAK
ncbi:MAG: DUF4091 domain-containing protein [Clostridia bacterium]|nr:DUF4091 domain-containing protein [Clostridia bacterium]